MRHFLTSLLTSLFCGLILSLEAQNLPLFNSFYANPYLNNPAEAITEQSQLFLIHRQQWTNLEGAPVISGATFTSLMSETRAGFGAKVVSYKRGLLNTTDLLATYAYGIPLGQKNWMFLGLSGGVISNSVDLTRASNPDDPALTSFQNNNTQPAANFGALYRAGSGLNIGLSLPQLFPQKFNNETAFSNTTVSPTDNVFFTIYYRRKVEGVRKRVKTSDAIAPLELHMNYRYSKYKTSQFEFVGKLNLSQHFWLGGSYKLPYGYTGNVGLNFSRFVLSYSYEPIDQPEDGFSQGSHEVMLGFRLGDVKKLKRATPVLRSVITKEPVEKHIARFQESSENPDNINTAEDAAKKKFYVVISSFVEFNKADEYKSKLVKEKFNADIFYNAADRKYYVHVLETTKAHEAHEEVKNLKNFTKLKTARVLEVINKQ
jgi:type IX secretion system PorP/SprF family membrane protein